MPERNEEEQMSIVYGDIIDISMRDGAAEGDHEEAARDGRGNFWAAKTRPQTDGIQLTRRAVPNKENRISVHMTSRKHGSFSGTIEEFMYYVDLGQKSETMLKSYADRDVIDHDDDAIVSVQQAPARKALPRGRGR
jgi:hypothetical protein